MLKSAEKFGGFQHLMRFLAALWLATVLLYGYENQIPPSTSN